MFEDEPKINFARAIRHVPGGPVDPSTIYRWVTEGIRGVKLEHIRVGKRILTSVGALERFFDALTDADRQRQQSAAKPSIESQCQKLGI